MLKLIEKSKINGINILDMKDGDVGVIISWCVDSWDYEGRIVQRYGAHLVTLGSRFGGGSDNFFTEKTSRNSMNRVRLLTPGETLIVE